VSEAGAADGAPAPPSAPSAHKSETLKRARRLRRHNDFLRVERSGVRAQGKLVSLVARPGRGRVGFTVSKKVSLKANERNLVKRRLREIVRKDRAWWQGLDVVVVARAEAVGTPMAALADDVARTVEKLRASLKGRGRGKDEPHGDEKKPQD
jgi:ribonuclease P protein component